VNPQKTGTKVAAHYRLAVPPGKCETIRLRLTPVAPGASDQTYGKGNGAFGKHFDDVLQARRQLAERRVERHQPRVRIEHATRGLDVAARQPRLRRRDGRDGAPRGAELRIAPHQVEARTERAHERTEVTGPRERQRLAAIQPHRQKAPLARLDRS